MNNVFFQLRSFLNYWLDNVDEHSLHSPFFFKFYTTILKKGLRSEDSDRLDGIRKKLLADNRSLLVEDLGAGSAHFKKNSPRKVGDIARTSVTPFRYSNLYYNIIKENGYRNIIELGTSLGLNTLYLAMAPSTRVTTFEGGEALVRVAGELFQSSGMENIMLISGNIDITLPAELHKHNVIDFALIDANHRYTPTLKYFDLLASNVSAKSMIVLDDIHSSREMDEAWREIRNDTRVQGTADLYRCGLVFFDPSLNKQHVVLRF